ncbi:kelch-like protein 25 [Oculina patagonica]
MARFLKSDNSEQINTPSPSRECLKNEEFTPKDTLDQPCDVVLVVEDGKQFKARGSVLKKASPFFEKLLNSDMKESKEGVVRLEMFSESVMAATLAYIYTGHVQILAEDNARDLIVMADYLFLQKLKTIAGGVLTQKLNISNCISTYYFSERYQCEELLWKTKKFILANFTAVYAANREDVLNMSSKEIEMWISSYEIDVSAEEDVFKFILAWIDHDKKKRKKYFAELFRHVRLVYVSRDFLSSDVVTNDLVKDTESCLDLVKDTIGIIDSKKYNNLPVPPRKSLETPIIFAFTYRHMWCYFHVEDSWYCLEEMGSYTRARANILKGRVVPCHGELNAFTKSRPHVLTRYNPYTDSWTEFIIPFLEENRVLQEIFVRNEDEMYALVSERSANLDLTVISKYKPLSNSWEDVSSFDSSELRPDACIVDNDNFIYFIGGTNVNSESMSDVDRYDLSKYQWDKVADIQIPRKRAHGAAANGKIFIAGGDCYGRRLPRNVQCEVFDETLNEWQFINCFNMRPVALQNLLSIDDNLYAVGFTLSICEVECYNSEKNEWEITSEIVSKRSSFTGGQAFSLRIFKEFFNPRLPSFPPKARQGKCLVM